MDLLDANFLMAAIYESNRAGLLISGLKNLPGGYWVQETWMDPIFAYCGAAA